MNKSDRLKVFNKFSGRCAYCGCELEKGWHVDEFLPVKRIHATLPAYNNGKKWVPAKMVWTGKYDHPERMHIDNQMPACPSCNINKHSMSIEEFRGLIGGFMKHLNNVSVQYKIAKRFGLVQETMIEVKFYYENFEPPVQ